MILLLEETIKSCLILALAFTVTLFMRRSSAARRHLVWVAAFFAIAFLPLCTLLVPSSFRSNLPSAISRVLTTPKSQYSGPVVPVEILAEEPASARTLHIDDINIDAGQNTPLNAMLPAEGGTAASRPEPPSGGPRGSGPASNSGQQYRVGSIKVMGAKAITETQIVMSLGLVPGQVYDEDRLRSNFGNLKNLYGSRGYINFVPMPVFDLDEQQKVVNLTINIDEDQQFTVNRINFTGNTTTRDEVIRREILVKEGQVFNSSLWALSLSRLNQLGYLDEIKYEDVEITLSPTEPRLDINLKVREKTR